VSSIERASARGRSYGCERGRAPERGQGGSAAPAGLSPGLVTALRRLPMRQRSAVVLHYVGDLSVDEVARSMGISTGAVNRHLFRGRETLRRILEVEG
jgi:DNA-directed RNA polymerase specialized sigma24 family protein